MNRKKERKTFLYSMYLKGYRVLACILMTNIFVWYMYTILFGYTNHSGLTCGPQGFNGFQIIKGLVGIRVKLGPQYPGPMVIN